MKYKALEVNSRRQMNDFIRLPYYIYSNDINWTPPLNAELRRTLSYDNPYFRESELKLFNCYNGNKIAARVCLVFNRKYRRVTGENCAFFGFFECLPDYEAAGEIFNRLFTYCGNMGIDKILGPFNPNHYSELGLQITKFNTPHSFFQTYNPEYYFDLLENNGFCIASRLLTMNNENAGSCLNEKFSKPQPEGDGEFKTRPFSMRNMKLDLEIMREIFNDAFSENKYFIPLEREEYLFSAKFLKLVTSPGLIKIVEHNNHPVGVLHMVLDINPLIKKLNGRVSPLKYLRFLSEKKDVDRLIIYAVGIRKSYRHSPAYRYLLNAAINEARDYRSLETTWISENNPAAVNAAKKLLLSEDKEFVIMDRKIR